jgi:hypothetical protein
MQDLKTDASLVRTVKAVHGCRESQFDPDFEVGLVHYLRDQYSQNQLSR